MGWNLRDDSVGAGGSLAGLHGGYLEFSDQKNADDPRPSIRERYPDRESYLAKVSDAVLKLWEQGYLLEEDALSLLNEAAQLDLWTR